jgi:hypothetical protein
MRKRKTRKEKLGGEAMEKDEKKLLVKDQGEVVKLIIDDQKVDDLLSADGAADRTWWRFNATGFTHEKKPVASNLTGVIIDFEKVYKKFDGNKPPERRTYKKDVTLPEDFELRLELGVAPVDWRNEIIGLDLPLTSRLAFKKYVRYLTNSGNRLEQTVTKIHPIPQQGESGSYAKLVFEPGGTLDELGYQLRMSESGEISLYQSSGEIKVNPVEESDQPSVDPEEIRKNPWT